MGAVVFGLFWLPMLVLCRVGIEVYIRIQKRREQEEIIRKQQQDWAERVAKRQRRIKGFEMRGNQYERR